jgi:acetolactate synthase-1/2/3 large subunit
MMHKTTGARALVAALSRGGVRHLFGIPGVHTLPLYDALADYPDVRPIVTRHEAGAAFAADGYARISGRPGVLSVVPGPGALNAATGVLCAWSDRVPMVLLTVELDSSQREAAVHEGDLAAIFRPFTRAQLRISQGEDIAPVIAQALRLATRAPTGPVQVMLPLHLLQQAVSVARVPVEHSDDIGVDEQAIAQLEAFLAACRSPTLMLGMGLAGAEAEAQALAERLGAPAFTDVGVRGIIPEDHPLAAGTLPWPRAQTILDASDGMLVLGSRLSEISTLNWNVRLPRSLARVDADASQLQANYAAMLAIQADPRAVLRFLLRHLSPRAGQGSNRAVEALNGLRQRNEPMPESRPGCIHPRAAVRQLRAALPRDAIVTTDGTATEFWLSEESFPVLSPAGFLVPEVQQTMGYGLAAAIGAAIATSDGGTNRPAVCVTGDGSLQMLLGELATAAGLGRQLTVVIFEDGYYNALRIYQDGIYGRQVGVRLANPDFLALGQAYGAHTERVDDAADILQAIKRSLSIAGLSIIALAIDPEPLPDRYERRLRQMSPARAS